MNNDYISKKVIQLVIRLTREHLERLIEKKEGDLLHPDVVSLSQFLDRLIMEYEKLSNNE